MSSHASSDRHRDGGRSRSPTRESSSRSRRHDSRSRSRSHDRHSSKHRRRRSHSDSRSRSRSRSSRRSSKHSSSSHRHSSSRKHESRHTHVKKESDEESKTGSAPVAAAASHHSHHHHSHNHHASKAEPKAEHAAAGWSAAGSSSFAAALPPNVKTEDEPSERELTAALEAAAVVPEVAAAPARAEPAKKAEINYGLSGRLAAASSALAPGLDVKYQEPPDARMPEQPWRLYVFKGDQQLDEPLRIHRQSMFMIGRDETACDIVVAHPSCSKQHAVIQFRQREVQKPDGSMDLVIKSGDTTCSMRQLPYLFDLGSTNGTYLMGVRREPSRFYELFENDLIKFGFSTREYVLLKVPASAK